MNSRLLPDPNWINSRIAEEPYWFHRLRLPGGIVTPGWSDPSVDKLPHFGLPADMSGMRVLDIGNAEGFFSFEAERRGAAEVVGIENYPPMARKFEICRAAFGSHARTYMVNVYDLNPGALGTFDLVMFFGVLYHLRHPILALQKVASVCTGTLLMQTATCDDTSKKPMAEFHPFGIKADRRRTPVTIPLASGSQTSPAAGRCFNTWDFKRWSKSRRTLPSVECFEHERPCNKKELPRRDEGALVLG